MQLRLLGVMGINRSFPTRCSLIRLRTLRLSDGTWFYFSFISIKNNHSRFFITTSLEGRTSVTKRERRVTKYESTCKVVPSCSSSILV